MKTNVWLVIGMMLSCGLYAQDLTNSPAASAIQPVAPEPAAAVPAETAAVTNAAPAKPKAAAPKKKSVAPKRAAAPALRTIPLVAGPATVSARNVNIRGQASFKGEVIGRLTKGDQVTVIEEILLKHSAVDEPSAWAKIVLPPSARVFVSSAFINQADGTVTARRLNMRGGPGENYSVLGRLQRGDVVKVMSTKDGWVQIEPPTNAYAFMAAQYLTQEAPASIAAAPVTQVDTSTPATTTTLSEPATIAAAPTTDLSVPPSTNTAPETDARMLAANTDSGSVSNAVEGTETEEEEPPPPRIVQREGVVRGTVSVQAPTRYELWSPESRQVINYLHTNSRDLDLSQYKGIRIVVTGEESLDERWLSTPVIEIHNIEVIE
jgi:uncharacterized protein YgiM (DUF1202 family)